MILFAWDFHGVLERGNDIDLFLCINGGLKMAGRKERVSLDQVREHYGASFQEFPKLVLPDDPELLKKVIDCAVDCYRNRSHTQMTVNYHVKEILEAILGAGHHNILISTVSQKEISKWTEAVGISDCFNAMIGIDSQRLRKNGLDRAAKKADAIKDYAKSFSFSKIVTIGDTKPDIEAGKKCGAVTYFYKPNFNHNPIKNIAPLMGADHAIIDLRKVLKEL